MRNLIPGLPRATKSQAKWYKQSRLRSEDPQRPGKNVFSWSDSEARLNAQFSRVAKISSYPQPGPASRPIPQDILRRWEKSAREGSYITNHAAAFSRCTSEIQEKMGEHINFLQDLVVKGKAPKEVNDAIKELKDLSAFTPASLLPWVLCYNTLETIFLCSWQTCHPQEGFYLDYLKAGVKPDTWNRLRNAPLFYLGLFPDNVLAIAEQDIIKHENNLGASGPSSGTQQHHGRRSQYRYKPYEKKENKHMVLVSLNNLGDSFLNRAEVVDVEVPVFIISPRPPVVPNHTK